MVSPGVKKPRLSGNTTNISTNECSDGGQGGGGGGKKSLRGRLGRNVRTRGKGNLNGESPRKLDQEEEGGGGGRVWRGVGEAAKKKETYQRKEKKFYNNYWHSACYKGTGGSDCYGSQRGEYIFETERCWYRTSTGKLQRYVKSKRGVLKEKNR